MYCGCSVLIGNMLATPGIFSSENRPILLLLADGKFHQLPSGELLIHNLEFSDQFATYRCRTMHRLSRQVVISSAANVNIAGEPLHFVH